MKLRIGGMVDTSIVTSADHKLIGFCGKLYPLLVITSKTPNSSTNPIYWTEVTDHYCYSTKDVLNTGLIKEKPKKAGGWWDHQSLKEFEIALDKFFFLKGRDVPQEFLDEPIFRIDFYDMDGGVVERRLAERSLELSPELKKDRFYQVFDAYTAFQELSMYIGGVVSNATYPPITIADKDMVVSKGFDPVYGFRTRKKTG